MGEQAETQPYGASNLSGLYSFPGPVRRQPGVLFWALVAKPWNDLIFKESSPQRPPLSRLRVPPKTKNRGRLVPDLQSAMVEHSWEDDPVQRAQSM